MAMLAAVARCCCSLLLLLSIAVAVTCTKVTKCFDLQIYVCDCKIELFVGCEWSNGMDGNR